MAAILLHPVTKKPSVYWYEPNGKKRKKTFQTKSDAKNSLITYKEKYLENFSLVITDEKSINKIISNQYIAEHFHDHTFIC